MGPLAGAWGQASRREAGAAADGPKASRAVNFAAETGGPERRPGATRHGPPRGAVTRDGNQKAQALVGEIFELRRGFEWRGHDMRAVENARLS